MPLPCIGVSLSLEGLIYLWHLIYNRVLKLVIMLRHILMVKHCNLRRRSPIHTICLLSYLDICLAWTYRSQLSSLVPFLCWKAIQFILKISSFHWNSLRSFVNIFIASFIRLPLSALGIKLLLMILDNRDLLSSYVFRLISFLSTSIRDIFRFFQWFFLHLLEFRFILKHEI